LFCFNANGCVCCSGDGGAIYLKDNSTLEFENATSTTNRTSSTNATKASHRTAATPYNSSRRVIIAGNRAKARGGGVAISGFSSFDVAAVLQATHNNSAEFDAEASVPLQQISVVGPSYISGLASRWGLPTIEFKADLLRLVAFG
jgi:hypothetical protein